MLAGLARMAGPGQAPPFGAAAFDAIERFARSFEPSANPTIADMAFEVGQLLQRETAGLALIEIEAARDPNSAWAFSLPLNRTSHALLVAAHSLLLELAPYEADIRDLLRDQRASSTAVTEAS